MLFRTDCIYKHELNTDVAFQVRKQFSLPNKVKLRITWYNIVNPKNIYRIEDDKIEIKKKDLKKWKIYEVT